MAMDREYREYLSSPAWLEKKERLISAAGKCQLCGGKKSLLVHHNSYANIFNEPDEDLIVLCRSCHRLFHRHRRVVRSARSAREESDLE